MKSPVFFQALEEELGPVLKYLSGHVLNAGCGERDLTALFKENGAAAVGNCDRRSSIPGAILCDLIDVPVASATYDAIVCNAVMEHVQFPDLVMKELRRLLKPGGHLILCIPFLQPYHPRPDYRRYTMEGMNELARLHEFDVIEVLPVHNIAQTITWITWSFLEEKRKRFLQLLLWAPFYLWNRFCPGTDFNLKLQANSFQAVLRKPAHQHHLDEQPAGLEVLA
jgi:SAM-dependent methyltransferase